MINVFRWELCIKDWDLLCQKVNRLKSWCKWAPHGTTSSKRNSKFIIRDYSHQVSGQATCTYHIKGRNLYKGLTRLSGWLSISSKQIFHLFFLNRDTTLLDINLNITHATMNKIKNKLWLGPRFPLVLSEISTCLTIANTLINAWCNQLPAF